MTHEPWPLSFHTGHSGQPGRYFDIYLINRHVLSSSLFFSRPLFVLSRFFPSNGWFGIPHRLLILLSEHLSQPHVHLLIYTPHFGQFHHPLPACQMTFSLALWPTTWYPTLLSSIILVSNLPAPNSPVSSVELRSLFLVFFGSDLLFHAGQPKAVSKTENPL